MLEPCFVLHVLREKLPLTVLVREERPLGPLAVSEMVQIPVVGIIAREMNGQISALAIPMHEYLLSCGGEDAIRGAEGVGVSRATATVGQEDKVGSLQFSSDHG